MHIKQLELILKSSADHVSDISGVVKCTEDIYATYYCDIDHPGTIKSLQYFSSCKVDGGFDNQIKHTTKLLELYKETITVMCDVSEEESLVILTTLGLFDNSFTKGKQTFLFDFIYKVEVSNGLLLLTISEM